MTDWTTIYLLIPEIVLIAGATLIYMAGAFLRLRVSASWLALVSLVVASGFLYFQDAQATSPWNVAAASASGPLAVDLFGHVARWLILAIGLALVLMTSRAEADPQRPEEAASILLMLAGLMIVAAANELILIFVGLELVSIPTYVVLYVGRHDARGQEAASKYFFLSILSSAVLLYGFSFLYGVGGSTRLSQIAATLSSPGDSASLAETLVPLGLLFTFGGLAFRLTAAPFHFYAPDVYEGTSHANAGLLATLPKIAGLLALARIALTALPGWEALGWKVVLVVSVVTMTLGNVVALWQTNVRRLLAYSSIAHAGYLLVGVAVALAARTAEPTGDAGALLSGERGAGLGAASFYLLVYMFATLGAFAALVYLGRDDAQVDSLDQLAGLNRTHPVVALLIAAFMFSLAGVPPLAGFWGKFALLYSSLTLPELSRNDLTLRPWFIGLAIVTVLNAAIGAAYYLRVIGAMYFRPSHAAVQPKQRDSGPLLAMALCIAAVIGVGLLPGRFLEIAVRGGQSILQPAPAPATAHRLDNPLKVGSESPSAQASAADRAG
jgi:NADH-quinone oxidoreductase subunit N